MFESFFLSNNCIERSRRRYIQQCSYPSLEFLCFMVIFFYLETDQPSTTTAVSGGPSQGVGNSMLPVVVGAAAGGVVVIIIVVIIIIIIVIIVFFMRTNNLSEPTYDLPADYEKPLAPPVETIPPRLEMKENITYEQIKSFDMTANSAYS